MSNTIYVPFINCKTVTSVIFLCSGQFLYPVQVVKYVFPLVTELIACIHFRWVCNGAKVINIQRPIHVQYHMITWYNYCLQWVFIWIWHYVMTCIYSKQFTFMLEQKSSVNPLHAEILWGNRKNSFCQLSTLTLQRHHNEHHGVSNHQHLDCLLNRLFRFTSQKTSKLRASVAFVKGIYRWPVSYFFQNIPVPAQDGLNKSMYQRWVSLTNAIDLPSLSPG